MFWQRELPVFCPLQPASGGSWLREVLKTGLLCSPRGFHNCTSSSNEETLQLPLPLNSHQKGEQLFAMEKQWERDWGGGRWTRLCQTFSTCLTVCKAECRNGKQQVKHVWASTHLCSQGHSEEQGQLLGLQWRSGSQKTFSTLTYRPVRELELIEKRSCFTYGGRKSSDVSSNAGHIIICWFHLTTSHNICSLHYGILHM